MSKTQEQIALAQMENTMFAAQACRKMLDGASLTIEEQRAALLPLSLAHEFNSKKPDPKLLSSDNISDVLENTDGVPHLNLTDEQVKSYFSRLKKQISKDTIGAQWGSLLWGVSTTYDNNFKEQPPQDPHISDVLRQSRVELMDSNCYMLRRNVAHERNPQERARLFRTELEGIREQIEKYGLTDYQIDLSGINLSGTDLSGINLDNVNMSNAKLQKTNLTDASLKGTVLQGASLRSANVQGADFEGSVLSKDNLVGAKHVDQAQNVPPVVAEEAAKNPLRRFVEAVLEAIGLREKTPDVVTARSPLAARQHVNTLAPTEPQTEVSTHKGPDRRTEHGKGTRDAFDRIPPEDRPAKRDELQQATATLGKVDGVTATTVTQQEQAISSDPHLPQNAPTTQSPTIH